VIDLQPGTYYWCACGRSQNQPFCDGSHKVTTITPMEFKLEAAQKCALCQCKQTKNKPFCDGTHRGV
jgi:CDGSH-type Zn-finger protein